MGISWWKERPKQKNVESFVSDLKVSIEIEGKSVQETWFDLVDVEHVELMDIVLRRGRKSTCIFPRFFFTTSIFICFFFNSYSDQWAGRFQPQIEFTLIHLNPP